MLIPFYLGIDGGGTKTELKLTDAEGNTVGHVFSGPCNPFDIGMDRARSVLEEGIKKVCAGVELSSVVLFAGLAGGASGNNKECFTEFFRQFHFAAFDNDSDNENIIAAGLGERDGVTLIMGTGVCAYRVRKGVHERLSGWGYLLDDGGSGYNLGRDALHAYYAAMDKTGEDSLLVELIEKDAGCAGDELLTGIYDGGKRYIASFAPLVFQAAEQGDGVADAILRRNASVAAQIVKAAAAPLDMELIPVVTAGGIAGQPRMLEYLREELTDDFRLRLEPLQAAPVEGALMRARQLR